MHFLCQCLTEYTHSCLCYQLSKHTVLQDKQTHTLYFSVIANGSSQSCHLQVCLLILPVIFKEQSLKTGVNAM